MTGAKPVEVEAALQHGWTLVNCSVARSGSGANTGFSEHCYFVGEAPGTDAADAGSPEK